MLMGKSCESMTASANIEDALYNIWPRQNRAREVAAAVKCELPDGFDIYRRWASGIGLVREDIERVWQAAAAESSQGMPDLLTMADTNNNQPMPDALRKLNDELRASEMTKDKANDLAQQEMVVPGLISRGHLIVIRGIPGCGKTTLACGLMSHIQARGFDGRYYMMDAAGDQLLEMFEKSEREGWKLHTPQNPEQAINTLLTAGIDATKAVGKEKAGLSNQLFVFDTAKSFVPLDKVGSTRWLQLFKRFRTETGATVVLLHHSTKFKQDRELKSREIQKLLSTDGTAEWLSEPDESYLLISEEDRDSLVLELFCEKSRNGIARSYDVPADVWEFRRGEQCGLVRRKIEPGEAERRRRQRLIEENSTTIKAIMVSIPLSSGTERELKGIVRADLKNDYCGDKAFRELLANPLLCDHPDFWSRVRLRSENNRWHYFLTACPPEKLKNLKNLNNRLSDNDDGIPF